MIDYSFTSAMWVMILNYLDKKSMYIGPYKTPNKALSCLVLSREGARGASPPPLIVRTKWGPKSQKIFFLETGPPLSQSLDDRSPPPPAYLKVWIRHWRMHEFLHVICHPRGYSLILAIQVCAAPSGRVFAPVWSENGYTLCPFWSGIGYGFWGNYGGVWPYLSFQFQMSK